MVYQVDATSFGRNQGIAVSRSPRVGLIRDWYAESCKTSGVVDLAKGVKDIWKNAQLLDLAGTRESDDSILDLLNKTRAVHNSAEDGIYRNIGTLIAVLGIYGKPGRVYNERLSATVCGMLGYDLARGIETGAMENIVREGEMEVLQALNSGFRYLRLMIRGYKEQTEDIQTLEQTISAINNPPDHGTTLRKIRQKTNTQKELQKRMRRAVSALDKELIELNYERMSFIPTKKLDEKIAETASTPWLSAVKAYLEMLHHGSKLEGTEYMIQATREIDELTGGSHNIHSGIIYLGLKNSLLEDMKNGIGLLDSEGQVMDQVKAIEDAEVRHQVLEEMELAVNGRKIDRALIAAMKLQAEHERRALHGGTTKPQEISAVAECIKKVRDQGETIDWDKTLSKISPIFAPILVFDSTPE